MFNMPFPGNIVGGTAIGNPRAPKKSPPAPPPEIDPGRFPAIFPYSPIPPTTSGATMSPKPQALFILDPGSAAAIYPPAIRSAIQALATVPVPPLAAKDALACPHLAETEVIFSGWGAPKLDAAFLAAAPKLKCVFYGAGSVRCFVTDEFWERGIRVWSAWAANAVPVAEFTLAQILLSLKQAWRYAAETRRLGAHPPRLPVAGGYGSTVALISLGMIARRLRGLLKPFDLKVIAFDPFVTPADAAALGVELVSLEEAFQRGDVVSLHTPWLKETEGMVTGAHFQQMKPNATFINTARGAVVNEPEMIAALQRRPDLTALLDVTFPEPPLPGSPLYTLPNVVLTPHIAGSMDGECARMGAYMLEEFRNWLDGKPPRWELDRDKAARLA
jgi:phosphoglycerate dehydrogenase-like enzyme